jgi:hypothetical protein
MRMMPAQPLTLKNRHGTPIRAMNKGRPAARVAHLGAPLKGLSRRSELTEGDPLLASILTNWIVEDDRITVRPGYIKLGQIAANTPVSALIPYYGSPIQKLLAASGTTLYDTAGAQVSTGWGGDDWAWTSYSDLSSVDYTIMVNGHDGVVSWDGAVFKKETVTAPTGETWVDPLKFDKVLSHMNLLWFADSDNLSVYYLPLQQKSGQLTLFPLNAMFKRGGHVVAMYTWTIDGGLGLDDAIVIFTSNGEAAIYSGIDPAVDFKLVGVFRFDAPMSKHSVINFGGDLYVLISTGFVPMTTLVKAEVENLGRSDIGVLKEFEDVSKAYRNDFGWQVMLNYQSGHAICNMPTGNNTYQQMVRKMPSQIWSKWTGVPSRCWGWLDNHTYFGTDDGGIYLGGEEYLNDNGAAINADVRFAWSSYKSVAKKNFTMLKVYSITDGLPRPFMDLETDYDNTQPTNQPEVTFGPGGGADWDISDWDVSDWAMVTQPRQDWQGITGLGRVGAPRIRVSITGCTFSITGVDVLYELGSLL